MNTKLVNDGSPRVVDHHRAFSPAIEAASHAMAIWTQGRVRVSLDEICEMALEDVGSAIANAQDTALIVSLGVVGDVGGQFLFTLDDAGASKLAGLLLNRPPRPVAEW